ncbi:MAG: hypothetical protein ABIS23_02365, partial [Sphingomicrobium sp.]
MSLVRTAYIFRKSMEIRRAALGTTASLAIAIALLNPAPAEAQFNGTAGPWSGVNASSLGTNNIEVTSSNAVINWTATSNDFLSSTSTQNFSSTSLSDYTVLNRITPADANNPIQLNGSVTSTVAGGAIGGNIWFYSPSGIIIGATANFDVGGLLLTSLTLVNAWSADADGFSVSFAKVAGDGGTITIDGGADIKALNQNSYIAIVAPRIVQDGSLATGGSAALVAAETLTMTMTDGLFNIQVGLNGGTGDDNGIVHTGSTTGPTTGGNIYMVAVPKNQALTMLLDGTIGFDATSATELNGQIILSAGWNVNHTGEVVSEDGTSFPSTNGSAHTGASASILIGASSATTFTSNVYGISSGTITALATLGNLDFAGDLVLRSFFAPSLGDILLSADAGYTLTVGDNVDIYSTGSGNESAPRVEIRASGGNVSIDGRVDLAVGKSIYGTYGTASLFAQGGSLTIDGATTLNAAASAASPDGDSQSTDNQGGQIYVEAYNGGSITTGAMSLNVSANGQNNDGGGDLTGGDGTGGIINIISGGNGAITVNGNLTALADGYGGNLLDGGVTAGTGYGGTVYMRASGTSTIDITGNYWARSLGIGGTWQGSPNPLVANGGVGDGGWANIENDGGTIDIDGNLTLEANGTGGNGQTGGDGFGGNAGVFGDDGSLTFGGNASVAAIGFGGSATTGFGGSGGNGWGGVAFIEANAYPGGIQVHASAASITGGNATVDASGVGGNGGAGDGTTAAGNGGNGYGGLYTGSEASGGAFVLADAAGGTLSLSNIFVYSNGRGGIGGAGGTGQVGGTGGNAFGGTAQAGNRNEYGVTSFSGSATFGDVTVSASGQGGAGGAGEGAADDGDGGDGTGGTAVVTVRGTTSANSLLIQSNGTGGVGANGGNGYGGGGENVESVHAAQLFVDANSAAIITGNVDVQAIGLGGVGLTGNGGDGFGGTGYVTVSAGGTLDAGDDGNGGRLRSGDIFVRARGEGGAGGNGINGGDGGDGVGGSVLIDVSGSAKVSSLAARAHGIGGIGGNGAIGGDGGDGYGSDVSLTIDGTLAALDIEMNARGVGGDGGTGSSGLGGAGGDGDSGTNDLSLAVGGILNARTLGITSSGVGCDGGNGFTGPGNGGFAIGGVNIVTIDGVATFAGAEDNFEGVVVTAFGDGGEGATGGDASAGSSTITINGSLTSDGRVQASAGAAGGIGTDAGGDATGGTATVNIYGSLSSDVLHIRTSAFGGSGAVAGDSFGGDVQLTIGSESIANFGDVELLALGDGGFVGVTGDLTATGEVDFDTGGDIVFDNVTAEDFDFDAGGSVTGGNINASTSASGHAEGALVLDDITVGPGLAIDDFSVGFSSATSIAVGNVSGAGKVGFVTPGTFTSGNLTAGDLLILMVSGDITTGSITTAADGRVYLADSSMFATGGGGNCEACDFDPAIVLALAPVATGGSITINGAVTTGTVQAAAGTTLSVGDITATDSVDLLAGGLASFYGTVSAPTITVTSSDIYVDFDASLGVFGITDLLTLNAVNSNGVYFGTQQTELPFGVYSLDEGGDIEAANFVINAMAEPEGATPNVYLGDLSFSGTEGGELGPESVTVNTAGSILVNGAVEYYNAAATDTLTLNAGGNIIVDTDTGSIFLYTYGPQENQILSGNLVLNAHSVWVAESAIIDQLLIDPLFAGRNAALAVNNGTSNPLGFVGAGGVSVSFSETFLVQNSGTGTDMGGVSVGDNGLTVSNSGEGLGDMFIYARGIASDGTETINEAFAKTVVLGEGSTFTSN